MKQLQQNNKRYPRNLTDLREAYYQARTKEIQRVVEAIKQNGWLPYKKHSPYCRQGSAQYSSQSLLPDPSYNLRNWKWIVAHKTNLTLIIDFQIVEQDRKTKNIHALVDRIGVTIFPDPQRQVMKNAQRLYQHICETYEVSSLIDPKYIQEMTTKYTLPLNKDEIADLCQLVENKYLQTLNLFS